MSSDYKEWLTEIFDEASDNGYVRPSLDTLENTYELLNKMVAISPGNYITYPDHDGSVVIDSHNGKGGIVTVFVEEKGEALCIIASGSSEHFRCDFNELPNEKLIEWLKYIHDGQQ